MNSEPWVIAGVIATALSAIASFFMAHLTYRYVKISSNIACLTKCSVDESIAMVKETVTTRKETFRPYVTVALEYEEDSDIYLVVQNTGQTSAKQVQLHFDKSLKDMHGDKLEELAFSEPIPSMPPNWKYSTFINLSRNINEQNGYVLKQGVTVTYTSDSADPYTDYYVLNFSLFKNRRWIVTTHSDDPKKSLVSIAESIKTIADHITT